MGSDSVDLISLFYLWVLFNLVGGFDMWYGLILVWDVGNGEMLYVIQYVLLLDGYYWNCDGLVVFYEIGFVQVFFCFMVVCNFDGF